MSDPAVAATKTRRLADLSARFASAVILGVLAIATVFSGGYWFDFFWLLAGVGILYEWLDMARVAPRLLSWIIGACFLMAVSRFASDAGPDYALAILAVGALVLAALARPGVRLWAAGGLVYAGALIISLAILRHSATPYQKLAIFWLFSVVWGSDIMAYFVGRLVGGPKLYPKISPGKTWSGSIGGALSSALFGWAAAQFSGLAYNVFYVLGLGLLLAIAAQIGDISESAMKRHFGVKDSSTFIPGHGGLMDRLDGFLVASALAALIGFLRVDAFQAPVGLFLW